MSKRRGCFPKVLLLIVLIGAAAVAVPLLPLSPLKSIVELKLSNALGRKVAIESVRLNLLSTPYLILTGMTAQEDPDFGDGVFLKAGEVRAGLDVIQSLRTRQIVIDSITLKSPRIDLVKNPNGVWSWTTLGRHPSEQSTISRFVSVALISLSGISLQFGGNLSTEGLKNLQIEGASVRLTDHTDRDHHLEVLYKNIRLNASMTSISGEGSQRISQARGEMVAQSEEDGEAERFTGTLPFDLKIDGSGDSHLSVSGSVGPGPIETRNISIGAITLNGEIDSNKDKPMTGSGRMIVTDLIIHTINLSERVARALKLDQIGDMNAGTVVASLETDFNISQGVVNTPALRIRQLDGLGDATAPNGNFKIESALTVNYAATIVLSPEATSRVKTVSTTVGLLVTILETNNQLSVPINITGDVRNPEVQVDVSRIF